MKFTEFVGLTSCDVYVCALLLLTDILFWKYTQSFQGIVNGWMLQGIVKLQHQQPLCLYW